MHTISALLQAAVANDESTKETIDYLTNNVLNQCETNSDAQLDKQDKRPEFFLSEPSCSSAEFATFFLNHIRAQAQGILAAAQIVWDQEQQKAQKLTSKPSGKLPSGWPDETTTEVRNGHRRPNSNAHQAAPLPAADPPALDNDSFPALGSSSAQSAKHGKANTKVPAGALMRIVSQAPLQGADRSAGSGAGGSKRRLAPTPVAQVARDQNFAAQQQAATEKKKGPPRKLAPTPVTAHAPEKSFSSAVSFASDASQPQQKRNAENGFPAASAAGSGSLQTPAKASYASAMSSPTSLAGQQATKRHGPATPSGSSMQRSTGGQAKQHTPNGEQQSAWSTPPEGGKSGTEEDALSRRMAGLGLSSPALSKSRQNSASPWGQQNPFVSYSEGFSEQATHGSARPAGSSSNVGTNFSGRAEQLGAPVSAQSCVGSNDLLMSRSHVAPATPGSAASVTSRLARTDGAAFHAHGQLDSPAARCSGSSLTFAGTPQEPGLPAATNQPAEDLLKGALRNGDVSAARDDGGVTATDINEGPAALAPHARRTAAIHAVLLSSAGTCSLGAELEVLMHLLAVPAEVQVHAKPEEPHPLFSSGAVAASYACAVLQDAGHAVEGLSVPVLDALVGSRQVAQQAPDLASRLRAVLDRRRQGDGGASRAYEQGIAGSAFELHAFTSDGLQKRSKEEQQRVTNQEAVRDEWFCLLKAALASASPLGRPQEQSGMQSRSGHALMDKDSEAAVLGVLVEGAGRLLRGVASGNLRAFARLFCAAVLQAAATGEALLDSELGALAARNPSRFSRLNQRLQGQSGASRGAPRMQPPLYRSRSPAASQHSATSEAGWSQCRPQQQYPRKKAAKGLDDGSAASLEVATMFPPAQRLFVLFLEAADSHRFNTHLAACMQERMQELMAEALTERGSRTAAKCEQALALATLAAYLSYLIFGTAGGSSAYQVLDVEGPVRAAAQKGALLWTLPWVNCYLWFLQPAEQTPAPLSPRLLTQMSQLRAAAALKPSHEAFGPAALCMRCLLDELLERAGPPSADGSTGPDLLELVPCEAFESSLAIEGELDARFLLLCTPQLEQARHALQAGSATAAPRVSAPMPKGLRKITPTAPFRPTAAAAAPPPDLPPEMAAAVARSADPDQRQLQSAFLGMYSNPESKVRLKTVVDFVGDMLGQTVKAAALKVAAAAASEEVARQLHHLVQSSAEALRTAGQPVTAEAVKASLQLQIPGIRNKTLKKAVRDACTSAVCHAEASAVQAVAALALPSWTPVVIGAAAAIAADNAVASCAQQLVTEVSNQMASIVQAQLDETVSARLKLNA